MQLETRRFGTIEVAGESEFRIPDGIPGFPDLHRVALIGAGGVKSEADTGAAASAADDDDETMFWMQDLDDGDLAFLCIAPWGPFPTYDVEIDSDELGIVSQDDVSILNLVTVRTSETEMLLTANLRAPLVVDTRHRRLHQVILGDSRWPVDAPFAMKQVDSSAEGAG